MDIATRRLRNQRLAGNPLGSADEVVGWLGAVQAQDYPAVVWALGQRTRDATAADVHRLFDAGTIVRTHVLRPTWHFALPADVRWLLALTAPRLRTAIAGRWRELGIDAGVMSRAEAAFGDALAGGRQLTRAELGAVLQAAGIAPDGQRLPHLILAAELDALVISGPRRGHDFTYMLMDDRVPATSPLSPEEALGRLAERYFRSRGPAQLQDFAWWAGATLDGARRGVATAGDSLASEVIDGKRYWLADPASDTVPVPVPATATAAASPPPAPAAAAGLASSRPRTSRTPVAHLLPNFDELTVAYHDRSAADHPEGRFDPGLFGFGSILSNVVVIGGRVRGAWRRLVRPTSVRVQVRLLDPLRPAERAAVERAADRMSRFLERPVEIEWEGPRAG
jgi:hypothetical protein